MFLYLMLYVRGFVIVLVHVSLRFPTQLTAQNYSTATHVDPQTEATTHSTTPVTFLRHRRRRQEQYLCCVGVLPFTSLSAVRC